MRRLLYDGAGWWLRVIALSLIFMAPVLGADKKLPPLTIGAEEWPPYEYLENGKPCGINVDIINHIFSRLGITPDYQFFPFTRSLMLADKGGIDAVLSVSFQPDRDSKFYFTDGQRAFLKTGEMPENYLYYSEYVFFLLQRLTNSFRFTTYEQIKKDHYHVGLINGYAYNKEFMDAAMGTHFYPSVPDALQALDKGDIDLLPLDRTLGLWLLDRLGIKNTITFAPGVIFSKPYHLAFARASRYPDIKAVATAFNDELKKMRVSGEYESIVERYIKPDHIGKITRPLLFVAEEWAPFEYLDGGKAAGIDVVIIDTIMKRMGIPYQIAFYPWSRAWMLAEKGKADAVLSVSYKSTREDVLYYTEEQRYYGETGVVPADYLWFSEYVFFVMKKKATQFTFDSYEQLKKEGVRIGKNRDYTYDQKFMEAQFEGSLFSSAEEGVKALISGEIDLYPMDKVIGQFTLQRLGLSESITWLPKPLFSKPYLCAFCKYSDFPEMERVMKTFHRELRILRASGEYDRIYSNNLKAAQQSTAGNK